MKIVVPILCLFVVMGVLYGMAFTGILPAQQWADKNPKLAPLLMAAHLARMPKPAKAKAAAKLAAKPASHAPKHDTAPVPPPASAAPLPVQAAAASNSASPDSTAPPDTHAKLDAIYAAMAPDDLARIFARLPDDVVVKSLMPMDEKKAGKVLAALPDSRAARLSSLMLAPPSRTASAASALHASLP